jgi:hypothetical protein
MKISYPMSNPVIKRFARDKEHCVNLTPPFAFWEAGKPPTKQRSLKRRRQEGTSIHRDGERSARR